MARQHQKGDDEHSLMGGGAYPTVFASVQTPRNIHKSPGRENTIASVQNTALLEGMGPLDYIPTDALKPASRRKSTTGWYCHDLWMPPGQNKQEVFKFMRILHIPSEAMDVSVPGHRAVRLGPCPLTAQASLHMTPSTP